MISIIDNANNRAAGINMRKAREDVLISEPITANKKEAKTLVNKDIINSLIDALPIFLSNLISDDLRAWRSMSKTTMAREKPAKIPLMADSVFASSAMFVVSMENISAMLKWKQGYYAEQGKDGMPKLFTHGMMLCIVAPVRHID